MSMEAKLMECLTGFDMMDLMGFARMLKIDGECVKKALCSAAVAPENLVDMQEWEDFICSIVEEFEKCNRKQKRELLKMAKQIVKENEDEKNGVNEEDIPPQE